VVGETCSSADRPWTRLIDDLVAGRWTDPDTGAAARVDFERVDIGPDLAEGAAELLRETMPAARYAVVSDERTYAALGRRVTASLGVAATDIVLDSPHADERTVQRLRERCRHADAVVAVGSGTINDLCKYATSLDARPYSVFGTAASMNGYTSTTASIELAGGMKTTVAAQAARGVFLDLEVSAAAPPRLSAAGFADCLCRSTAQVDWYLAHRLFGTRYTSVPYILQDEDEARLLERADGIRHRELSAIGTLQRLLTLGGLGISVAGTSHPGSMGEHQISHWIDNFAGAVHPGSLHGQQVGVATLTMARLQRRLLSREAPPVVHPTRLDESGLRERYPPAAVAGCLRASRAKALDAASAAALNERLEACWGELRTELLAMHVAPDVLEGHLRAAGAGTTPEEIGLDRDVYRRAVRHALEIRERYSALDLAADARLLDDFVHECV